MRTLRIFQFRDARFGTCPKCKTANLHRSRARTNWEQFLKKYTFFNIYRCNQCGWRGSKSYYVINKESFKAVGVYALLALASALIIRFVLTKFLIN